MVKKGLEFKFLRSTSVLKTIQPIWIALWIISSRVPEKWSVIESLDRSQDRESLDTLQAPIDRWHSSPRVLDPD